MNILVTGGAGYIGSHTAKELHAAGHNPVVLDNLSTGHRWAVQWGKFYQCDIRETTKVTEILRQEKIEVVVHFAAFAYVGESVEKPLDYYDNNVLGTMRLLEAMRIAGVKKMIFSSSCATYGVPSHSPVDEETPQNPINPYGRSKLMAEQILKDYVRAHAFSAVCLRYFNASGADQSLEIGEDHTPETRVIPLAIEAAEKSNKPLTVFGNDYSTPDGTCIRDYIHVSDLAKAHLLAIPKLNESKFQFYNLGTSQGFSVRQVITEVSRVTGKKVNFQIGARRPADPPNLVSSGKKAALELGWKPQSSSLENIVTTATGWYRKHSTPDKKANNG